MNLQKLRDAYPSAPPVFHDRLMEALAMTKIQRKRRHIPRALIALLAAALMLLGTAYALESLGIVHFVGGQNSLKPDPQTILEPLRVEQALPTRGDIPREQLEKRPKIRTDEALISLREASLDAQTLYLVYAQRNTGYEVGNDYLLIGSQERAIHTAATAQEGGLTLHYIRADVSDLALDGGYLEVTVPLSVYKNEKRYWNQHVTYRISADAAARTARATSVEGEDFTLQLDGAHIGPLETSISLRYTFTSTDAEQRAVQIRDAYSFAVDTSDGLPLTVSYSSISATQLTQGWEAAVSLVCLSPEKEASTLIVTPLYHPGGEGEGIPQTEQRLIAAAND